MSMFNIVRKEFQYGQYTVTLEKNPLSATGTLDFDNYIAEVMSYTNAAGRRMLVATPGNAEYVDKKECSNITDNHAPRIHEIDEAATQEVQVVAAAGEDRSTPYVWLYVAAVGIIVVAVGAFATKKYLLLVK